MKFIIGGSYLTGQIPNTTPSAPSKIIASRTAPAPTTAHAPTAPTTVPAPTTAPAAVLVPQLGLSSRSNPEEVETQRPYESKNAGFGPRTRSKSENVTVTTKAPNSGTLITRRTVLTGSVDYGLFVLMEGGAQGKGVSFGVITNYILTMVFSSRLCTQQHQAYLRRGRQRYRYHKFHSPRGQT